MILTYKDMIESTPDDEAGSGQSGAYGDIAPDDRAPTESITPPVMGRNLESGGGGTADIDLGDG